jgi:hypothetical protein
LPNEAAEKIESGRTKYSKLRPSMKEEISVIKAALKMKQLKFENLRVDQRLNTVRSSSRISGWTNG